MLCERALQLPQLKAGQCLLQWTHLKAKRSAAAATVAAAALAVGPPAAAAAPAAPALSAGRAGAGKVALRVRWLVWRTAGQVQASGAAWGRRAAPPGVHKCESDSHCRQGRRRDGAGAGLWNQTRTL